MTVDGANAIRTEPQPICILCGSAGEILYAHLQDNLFAISGTWNLKQCLNRACRLAWLDPMPVAEDIGKLYREYLTHNPGPVASREESQSFAARVTNGLLARNFGYIELLPSGWAALGARLAGQSRFLRECIGMSVSWLHGSSRGSLMDVGSGNGAFLARMRGLGWNVTGVEPDMQAAQVSRETYNLTVHCGLLGAGIFSNDSFDAITFMHVIEHLRDPFTTLRTAHDVLRKGGRLVILTPNIASLGHRWFRSCWRGLEPPRHLFLFAPQSLRELVQKCGFKVVDSRRNAVSADSMWRLSRAAKRNMFPDDLSNTYASVPATLFMFLEHALTGWPFYRACGEQLALIAVKN